MNQLLWLSVAGGVRSRLSADEYSETYLKSRSSLYFGYGDNYILYAAVRTDVNKGKFYYILIVLIYQT